MDLLNHLTLSDILLRLGVFGVEIILTFSLIGWLRGSSRKNQEPYSFIFTVLLYGALTAAISAFVELKYSFNIPALKESAPYLVQRYGTWYQLINTFSASMIEEMAKYTVAVYFVINTKHNHKLSDSIIYLILIGLGFSLVEDFIFFLNPSTIAPYRLLSFYVHSGTSAIIGYSMGRFKFGLAGYGELSRAVVAAIGLHFMYNLSSTLNIEPQAFFLTLGISIYISLQIFVLFRKALLDEFNLDYQKQLMRNYNLLNLAKKKSVTTLK